jgi:hypothetical protein
MLSRSVPAFNYPTLTVEDFIYLHDTGVRDAVDRKQCPVKLGKKAQALESRRDPVPFLLSDGRQPLGRRGRYRGFGSLLPCRSRRYEPSSRWRLVGFRF